MEVTIASVDEIRDYRNRWNSIVREMASPTIFLTWEWITTWINHFGPRYRLLVLFIRDACGLLAILPFAQRRMRTEDGVFVTRTISFCGSQELYPDHLDIICGNEGLVDDCITAAMAFLATRHRNWDVLDLSFLAGEGNLSRWLKQNGHRLRMITGANILSPCLSLDTDYETFMGSMGRKKRYNLRREQIMLLERQEAKLERIRAAGELEIALDALFGLHRLRARDKDIVSSFDDETIHSFHIELARLFLELGWLRFYLLQRNERTIAAAYGFDYEGTYSFYQTGLDPAWKQFSPGKVLIGSLLEELFGEEKVREFDFLGGNDGYKRFWTKQFKVLKKARVFNSSLRATAEYTAVRKREILKRLIAKTPLYGIFRKWMGKR